ncbi:MAG TPA: DedA family protein [Pseudonocardia sp.]|jgi:membrane protein DedA with SNARE-associated domain|uniref:DedA family protein n=1 Tax=Pseudonocardia sp. TaxID=60912 RepID=UPI002F407884
MSAPLPGFLGALAPLLSRYGYFAVLGVVGVESFGVPAPGQTILIAAGVLAGSGQLNVVAVAACGFAASVVGDNIGYAIGKFGGRRLVLRFGRFILLTEERLGKAEGFFERHGGKIVAVARFVDGFRQVNGVISGIAGMSWWRFLAFNALGAALWVAVWVPMGYFAGNHVGFLYRKARDYQVYLLVGLGVLIVGAVAYHFIRNRRRHARDTEHGHESRHDR